MTIWLHQGKHKGMFTKFLPWEIHHGGEDSHLNKRSMGLGTLLLQDQFVPIYWNAELNFGCNGKLFKTSNLELHLGKMYCAVQVL